MSNNRRPITMCTKRAILPGYMPTQRSTRQIKLDAVCDVRVRRCKFSGNDIFFRLSADTSSVTNIFVFIKMVHNVVCDAVSASVAWLHSICKHSCCCYCIYSESYSDENSVWRINLLLACTHHARISSSYNMIIIVLH